jgi:hypothetical protein
MADEDFDSMKAGERISNMWMDLAAKIAIRLPEFIGDREDPALAIKWATCAEACFWKATGESDAHDVKDILAAVSTSSGSGK